jgi:glucose-6-phosphate 1-dehydrogenase
MKKPPVVFPTCTAPPNHLRFRVSPEVAVAFGLTGMDHEDKMVGRPLEITATRHAQADEMDAYERVLTEAMEGDHTIFSRQDYVEEAWRIVDPILKDGPLPIEYQPGTWGPRKAHEDFVPPGGWMDPELNPDTPPADPL